MCRCPLRSSTRSSTRRRAESFTINAACVPDGGVLVADASPLHARSSHDAPVLHPQRLREGPAVAAVAAMARCATGFMLKAPQCPGDGSWTLWPWDPAMSHRVPRGARRAHTQNTNAQTLSLSGLRRQRPENTGVLERSLLERRTLLNKWFGARAAPAA